MFRIDRAKVKELAALFTPSDPPASVQMSFTYQELLQFENIVLAADASSHRRGEPSVSGVTDQELAALLEWCAERLQWFEETGS
jgi:hypothetical protein